MPKSGNSHQSSDHSNGSESGSFQESQRIPQPRQILVTKTNRGFFCSFSKQRKSRNTKTVNYDIQQEQMEQEYQNKIDEACEVYRGGKIIKILAERQREQTSQIQLLCRLQGKSFLHLDWLTLNQIKQKQIQMLKVNKRQKEHQEENIREVHRKFGKQHFFNPAFIKVDRILASAVIFPFMHQKKGSEIAGKWSQSLMLVCSKMLNFEQDNVPFGVQHKDLYEEDQINRNNKNGIKLEHVINKIYLDRYSNAQKIWEEIGQSINSVQKSYGESEGQPPSIIKECVIFLYWQWYCLSRERYLSYQKEFQKQQSTKYPMPIVNFSLGTSSLPLEYFVKSNIFMEEKKGQPPVNKQELEMLNPGIFSYNWLSSRQNYTSFVFEELTLKDIEKLSLNIEIDSLFLIKWCELDYEEVSWQKQSDINCPEKIAQYKTYNKLPNKKIREKIQQNRQFQKKLLISCEKKDKAISQEDLDRCKRKLFCYQSVGKQPRQYGEQDRPIYKGYKVLKPFQLQSLNWMIRCWYERRNCILADEMGLGKTVQTIAFLNHLYTFENVLGPFLVIAPVSTLKQWRNEVQQWSDFNCILYKGKASSRSLIEQYQFYHNFVTNDGVIVKYQKLPKFQIFLTNFQVCVSDIDIIKKIAFQHIIIDEAHKMKNRNSKIFQIVRQLPCTRFLLLTGTPIQNNTSELWSLLNLIEPKKFPSFQSFKSSYGSLKTTEDLEKFKELLKPFLMRRVKSDVEKSIPKLSELIVDLQLTNVQKTYYRGILEQNKTKILNSLTSISLNNISISLRQCCNHPFMLGPQIQEQIYRQCSSNQQRMQKLIQSSTKTVFIHKIMQKCRKEKTKTLIFTQFLDMISILCEYCDYYGIEYESLDGSVNYEDRQNRIDRFNKNPNVLVFVISTKAGGIGINLTSATNIIIYDSDWNPQNDIQAISRAHRIGQKKSVTVYRLITSNTYQSHLFQSAIKKLGVGLAVLDNEFFANNDKGNRSQKTKQEIEKLLKNGVLGFLNNQNSISESHSIENFTIEEILEKTTRTVEYASKQCSFSKTKISSTNSNQENIDIDDPNFWEVALQNIETPLQSLVKKLDPGKTKKYSNLLDQENLMVQANDVVYNFMKQKISMTHFNAQDQRQLKNFLQNLSSSRQFHRKYRNIANQWLDQLEKPSRRYNKLELSQFKIEQKRHRSLRKETKKQEQPEKSQNQQEKPSLKSEKQKSRTRGEMRSERRKRLNQKEKEAKEEQQEVYEVDDKSYLLEIPCTLCERKKCSKICKKNCNRMFHKKCYDRYKNGEAPPSSFQVSQLNQSDQKVLQQISEQFECFQCVLGQAKCFICNKLDEAIVSDKSGNKSLKKDQQNEDQKHTIQKIIESANSPNLSRVFRCTYPGCYKFYHLQCLKEIKDSLTFDILQKDKKIELKCPIHFCAHCREKLSSTMICSCLRCPASYHKKKCRPLKESSILKITNDHFICQYHLSEKEIISKKEQRVSIEESSKKDRKEQKKRQKLKEQKQLQQNSIENKNNKCEQDEKKEMAEANQNTDKKCRKIRSTGIQE